MIRGKGCGNGGPGTIYTKISSATSLVVKGGMFENQKYTRLTPKDGNLVRYAITFFSGGCA